MGAGTRGSARAGQREAWQNWGLELLVQFSQGGRVRQGEPIWDWLVAITPKGSGP